MGVYNGEPKLISEHQHNTAKLESCFSLGMLFTITMTNKDWKMDDYFLECVLTETISRLERELLPVYLRTKSAEERSCKKSTYLNHSCHSRVSNTKSFSSNSPDKGLSVTQKRNL